MNRQAGNLTEYIKFTKFTLVDEGELGRYSTS